MPNTLFEVIAVELTEPRQLGYFRKVPWANCSLELPTPLPGSQAQKETASTPFSCC